MPMDGSVRLLEGDSLARLSPYLYKKKTVYLTSRVSYLGDSSNSGSVTHGEAEEMKCAGVRGPVEWIQFEN